MLGQTAIRLQAPKKASIAYRDAFVVNLIADMHTMIAGDGALQQSVELRLLELSAANSPKTHDYWARTSPGLGVPDTAFRGELLYLFSDQPPVRLFGTSGTTGRARGRAAYSPAGLELMNASILANARLHILRGLDRPAFIRLVPPEETAPEMVMAYGMALIERNFADPELSGSVLGPGGVDYAHLQAMIDRAVVVGRPVVLIGASFAFLNVCEQLEKMRRRWQLPAGSRFVDAGGFKGRSRTISVDGLRALVSRSFGIGPGDCVNLFGMTELASQLYDAEDLPVGPRGERPKAGGASVRVLVRDPTSLAPKRVGKGLLEVVDLCILDRPPAVLTGDIGVAAPAGVAITGRVERRARGCSLALDELTAGAAP